MYVLTKAWRAVRRPLHDAAAPSRPRGLGTFARDAAGDVAMMFGLMAMVIFLLIGAGVDFARWLNARNQTVSAIDSAVLAAARALQTNGGDKTAAVAVARKYYTANTAQRIPLASDTIDFVVSDDGTSVTATGAAKITTPFMGLANVKNLPLLTLSGSEYSKAQLAVGANAELNIEVSMALDITGSMCDSAPNSPEQACSSGRKIDAMKDAAKDLIDIVVWKDQSKYTSKVAITPFSAEVRPPSTLLSSVVNLLAPPTIPKSSGWRTFIYYRTDCVAERTGSNRYTDVLPLGLDQLLTVYSDKNECWIHPDAKVMPLTSDKDALKARIDGLKGAGGTAGHLGTAWAWYNLAPSWSSILSAVTPGASPAAYNTSNVKKIAIIMTDGEYNAYYDASGVRVGMSGSGNSANSKDSDDQAKELCTAMKGKGITVYTVGFELDGVSNPTAAKKVLSDCATDATTFYDAANGEELRQAFRDIALKISSLYLAK